MSCATCARIRKRLAEVARRARDRAAAVLELRRRRKRTPIAFTNEGGTYEYDGRRINPRSPQ
ncbi:MAG TPA: hypothetical protein VE907_06300 [Gammaproteobacteria bacterium]|nr:hypothetical protein [Gammaproteobacteria bacterium]